MNKRFLLLLISLILAVGMPESVMAKKVNYLGHEYKGEVNKNKIPTGIGQINVNGLIIQGTFDGQTVKDAKAHVWKDGYSTTYGGTITYDESDNVTLKAGGIISTSYFTARTDVKAYDEILKEDKVVNANNFETKTLRLPYTIELEDINSIPMELNSPREFTYFYEVPQKYHKKNGKTVFVDDLSFDDVYGNFHVESIKDSEGRDWYYTIKKDHHNYRHSFTVKYPDGSYYSGHATQKVGESRVERLYRETQWEIHYPDGKILKYYNYFLDLGNSFHVRVNDISFAKFKKLPTINLEKGECSGYFISYIYSDDYDFKTLTSQEGDKIIQEKLIPLLGGDPSSCNYLIESSSGSNTLGYIKAGKYISDADAKADAKKAREASKKAAEASKKAAEAKELAEYNAKVAPFKKKWGFDPNLDGKDVIKVGRKIAAINAWNEWREKEWGKTLFEYGLNWTFSLAIDHGASKCYNLIKNGHEIGYMWAKNGVVTSVSWY